MGILDVDFAVEGNLAEKLAGLEVAISAGSLDVWLRTSAHEHLVERARNRFASEGDDVSGAWAALAPATVADREAHGFPGPHPILHRTGSLERFITASNSTVAADGVGVVLETVSPTGELEVKMTTAQKGKGRVPARPVLGLGLKDATDLTLSLYDHLEALLTAGG